MLFIVDFDSISLAHCYFSYTIIIFSAEFKPKLNCAEKTQNVYPPSGGFVVCTSLTFADWRTISANFPALARLRDFTLTLKTKSKSEILERVRFWAWYGLALTTEARGCRTDFSNLSLALTQLKFEANCLRLERGISINIADVGVEAAECEFDVAIFTAPLWILAEDLEGSTRSEFERLLREAENDFRASANHFLQLRSRVVNLANSFSAEVASLHRTCHENGVF